MFLTVETVYLSRHAMRSAIWCLGAEIVMFHVTTTQKLFMPMCYMGSFFDPVKLDFVYKSEVECFYNVAARAEKIFETIQEPSLVGASSWMRFTDEACSANSVSASHPEAFLILTGLIRSYFARIKA